MSREPFSLCDLGRQRERAVEFDLACANLAWVSRHRRSSLVLGFWGLASSVLCASCSTILDPTTETTSDPAPDPTPDPTPTEEPVCGPQGVAGASFSTCAELPDCLAAGPEQQHLICEHALSYEAAAHECELRGGHLAEVNSAEENELLAEAAGFSVGTNVWLGGIRNEAFVWSWERSGVVFWRGDRFGTPEPDVYVKWAPGEPNDSSTVSDEPEKCLALTLGGSDWNDRACSLELPFVCEVD